MICHEAIIIWPEYVECIILNFIQNGHALYMIKNGLQKKNGEFLSFPLSKICNERVCCYLLCTKG